MTSENTTETILDEANRLVNGKRGSDYGHPLDNFTNTAKLWSVILGVEITAEQVALCMIQLKVARQLNKSTRDNLVDICGYAQTYDMVQKERKRRDNPESIDLEKLHGLPTVPKIGVLA